MAERSPTGGAPRNARARVRVELTREIVAAAREELAAVGAASLSLRAVARRLEMAPSALYRYFDSRDALLTALIIDSYHAVGAAAAEADGAAGTDPLARWVAVAAAIRRWGREHPHEWALVYGSPVPGYRAPEDTVAPAVEVIEVMAGILRDGIPTGSPPPDFLPTAPPELGAAVEPIESALLPGLAPALVAAALLVWTQMLGTVSFELFGHYVGTTTNFDLVFDYMVRAAASGLGLRGSTS
jgi:AcrR family transcriptional regulator